jgi:hypothetical protein
VPRMLVEELVVVVAVVVVIVVVPWCAAAATAALVLWCWPLQCSKWRPASAAACAAFAAVALRPPLVAWQWLPPCDLSDAGRHGKTHSNAHHRARTTPSLWCNMAFVLHYANSVNKYVSSCTK